ncbi:MAG: GlsB/YeaQ/YmgE family stress response membrane protein [Gemmatimonadetes bacterium]|nr:GlsB/YeaQ/YmgE family stress response membrane protein [Gemmatimonadota bacterium]
MGLVYMVVLGLIAGAIAKLLMPGKDPGGLIITMFLGIAGSVVGGYLGQFLGLTGGGPVGLLGSVAGAMILLAGYRVMKKKA